MGGGWRIGQQIVVSLYSARTRTHTIAGNDEMAPPSATRHPVGGVR